MNKHKTFKAKVLLSSLLLVSFIKATPDTVALAAAVTTPGAANNYDTMVLDRTTGDLYIGTVAVDAATNITKVSAHNADGSTPTSTGVASTLATNKLIRLMAPSYTSAGVLRLAFVENTTNTTKVCIQSADGTLDETCDAAIEDPGGADIAANGVLALAASSNRIFAAVADAAGVAWATNGRGVANIAIDSDATLKLEIVDGTSGNADNSGEATAVLETPDADGKTLAVTTAATVLEIQPSLHWDEKLSRLYLGTGVTAGNVGATDRAISVLVGEVNATGNYGVLDFLPTVADTAAFANVATGIVYTNQNATVVARHVKTMHTSTGHAYLIVNGGNGANNAVGNLVYAVPLVQGNDTATVNGTFAKNDLLTPDFSVQAVAAGDLVVNTAVEAKVGGGAAPFAATVLTTRLEVVGDTVYISGAVQTDGGTSGAVQTDGGTIECGVFYSTPVFNEVGKIVAWTPWTRACPAELGTNATDGDIANFRVDPRNGKFWTIVGDDLDKLNVSTWGEETATDELATAVNAVLTDGCTAIGVFDRATVNWGNNVGPRMSLFGGNEKVVFTVQSRTDADPAGAYSVVESPVGATANGATDFLSTTLPSGSGYVTALGGTNYGTTAKTFFFLAGTTKGLYAYANTDDSEGATLDYLAAENLHNLDGTAFTGASFFSRTNSWQAVSNITGHIKKIATAIGLTVVLARDIGTDGTIRDSVWCLNTTTDTTVTLLNTNAELVAQSGVSATNSDLTNATQIYDFAIITGETGGADSQIILATNNGLYQSKIAGGIQQDGTTQALALWTPIGQKTGNASTDGLMYTRLFQGKGGGITTTHNNSSFQGIHLIDNTSSSGTYAFRGIDQFGCSLDDNLATGNNVLRHPSTTNYLNSDSFTSFQRLKRIYDYWSDGARRFMIATPDDGSGTTGLYIWPYEVGADGYNITDPVSKVSASALSGKRLYCIDQLPDGHICVGTDTGIVVL